MAGRPPVYKLAEDLEAKIDEYFKKGVKKKQVVIGKAPNQEVVFIEMPTITGLCLYCGYASRQSFYDQEERSAEFSYIIKRARLFIENEYEEMLQYGNSTGAIFALKNMGWKDRMEQDINLHIEQPYFPDVSADNSDK